MNTSPVNVAVVDGKTIVKTTELKTASSDGSVRIKAIDNGRYILAEGDKGVAPENITVKRVGKDLHVALEGTDPDQPQLIIEGFFDSQGQLIGVGEDGAYYEYISSDAEQDHSAAFLIEDVSSPQVLGSEELVGFGDGLVAGAAAIGWFWPALLGLVGVGLAYAAIADDDDDNDHDGGGSSVVTPDTPVLGSVNDNVGDKTGEIENGGVTDDSTPTLKGTGTPGNVVVIEDNGKVIGETIVGEDGNWEFTPEIPLEAGSHEIVTIEKDSAGNESNPSDGFELIVDLTAPEKSVISDAQDDFGAQQGVIENNGLTDDNTPTLRGTAEAGSTVEVFANGVKIGETIANADGSWVYTPDQALADGGYTFTSVAVDAAGNRGLPSDPYVLTIDTTAPGTPGEGGNGGIDEVLDNVGDKQGPIESGGSTDDNTPTLGGSGQQPGDKVEIKDNGEVIGEAIVDENGKWTFIPEPPLGDGKHDLSIIVTDEAGNSSEESDPYTVIVDTTAPAQPAITSVVDDQGPDTGPIAAGSTTDDGQPDINGTAEPGSTVIIYDKGVEIGRAPVDANGNWSYTPTPPLNNGAHEVSVAAMDAAGNVGQPSDSFGFDVISGGAPSAPAITGVIDDVGNQQGNLQPGSVTDDARPTINGTGEVGSTVSVYADGVLVGTAIVGADGRWSVLPESDLPEGVNNITATTTNAAGNVSPETGLYPITVDTTAPSSAGNQVLSDNVGPVTDPITSGDTTDDNTPTFSGSAEPGSTVIIYDKDKEIARVTADQSGAWEYTPTTPLADGAHSFSTVVEDAAGNQSSKGEPIDFTVDTRAVEISITEVTDNMGTVQDPISQGGVTDDTTPTLSGKATPNSLVNIYDKGVLIGTAPSDAAGNWVYEPKTELSEGEHNFTATVTTEAGGESAPTAVFGLTIDTTAPGTPGEGGNGGIDTIKDDVGATQGTIENGGSTDDTTPTLGGGGQKPGDTISILDNGKVIDSVVADENGNWTYTPPPLNDGKHDFSMIVTDEAGNSSEESDPYTVIIDTTAPLTQAVIESMGKDSGSDSGDYLTNDGSAGRLIQGSLTAALAANEKVQVSVDGGKTWLDAVLNGDGTWSFVDETAHTASWEIQTRVVDSVGNGGVVQLETVTLDTTPPDAPDTFAINSGKVTVNFDGSSLNVGDTLQIVVGDERFEHVLTQAQIDAGTVDVATVTGATMYNTSANFIDQAGNSSAVLTSHSDSVNFEEATPTIVQPSSSADFGLFTFKWGGFEYNGSDSERPRGVVAAGTQLLEGYVTPSIGLGVWGEGDSSKVNSAQLTLNDGETATGVSFVIAELTSPVTLYFYDADGTLVYTQLVPITGDTGSDTIDVSMPPGVEFSSMSFAAITGEFFWLDDFVFQGVSDGFIQSAPDASQVVDSSNQYYGGDDDNLFTLTDTALLNSPDIGIHGNGGMDILRLTGADQVLDLTALGDKVSSMEVIDLTGSGDNTLKLSLDDVLNNGQTDLFQDSGKTQMMVNGDAGDVVDLEGLIGAEDPGSWGAQGQVTVGGVVYDVYSHSSLEAELLVQQGVTTNFV